VLVLVLVASVVPGSSYHQIVVVPDHQATSNQILAQGLQATSERDDQVQVMNNLCHQATYYIDRMD
jgi:hypothetical protein